MARCPTCRHYTGDPAIEVFECAVCHRVWCEACQRDHACRHDTETQVHAFVLSDDAYL